MRLVGQVLIIVLLFGFLYALFQQHFKERSEKTFLQNALTSKFDEGLEYARIHFPHEGRLLRKADGFVYLKVDDRYVHTLYQRMQLKAFGFRKVSYFRAPTAVGAHISVFNENEHVIPAELGQKIPFLLKKITMVSNPSKSYIVLQVESAQLEQIRRTYGKSPLLQNHAYHISIGVK